MAVFYELSKYLGVYKLLMKQLIFLHIEKAAGTSQRALFYQSFGKQNVYWYGADPNRKKFRKDDVEKSFVIGGHKKFNFYSPSRKIWLFRWLTSGYKESDFKPDTFGYIAVVRDPVERVISFFNYCRTQEYENWSRHKLDPNSLRKTLHKSRTFRRVIRNAQCRYLSGAETFEKAKENISKNKFVVASLEHIELLNDYLIRNIECVDRTLNKNNAGKPDYKEEIDIDDELKEEITELVSEDIKLYDFINNECYGLFDNISRNDWNLFNSTVTGAETVPKLRISIKRLRLHNDVLSAQVELHNESANEYSPDNCYIGLRLFDAEGKCCLERRNLIEPIRSQSRKTFLFRAEGVDQEVFKARFDIVDVNNKRWLGEDTVSISEFEFSR